MPKPIEITRIFGHLDRDPAAVAEVLARMPPEEARAWLLRELQWSVAIDAAYVEVTRDQGTL